MHWFKTLKYASYLTYLLEIAMLLAVPRSKEQFSDLAEALSDVLFRAVDQATSGLARHSVNGDHLTRAVGTLVDALEPVLPSRETPSS